MKDRISFRSVFTRNEFRALQGRCYSTIFYLSVILFVAFVAFGFSKSTLSYQQALSSDPFSNWINLDFHSGTGDSLRSLNAGISDKLFRDRFHIRGSYFYNKGMIPVLTFSHGRKIVQYETRTIDPRSDVVKNLFRSGVLAGNFPDPAGNPMDHEPNGVIISGKLAGDICPDGQAVSFIQWSSPMGDLVPVPVLAVVKELPDLSDVVCTNLFYCKMMNPGFYDRENPCYRMFVGSMDTAGILRVLGDLYGALEISDPSTVQTTVLKKGTGTVSDWKIEIGKQDKDIPAGIRKEKIANIASLKGHRYGDYFELSKDTACDNSAFFHDFLAVEFSDLEKIGDFSRFLKEHLDLQLNLEVLSQRENFLFTGNLALGSIILLMTLAIISVSIYISGIIRNHLLRIRKNLGNFLAFGVKNTTLIWLYIRVTIGILVLALVPAFILAFACGEFFEKFLLGMLLVLDPEQDYFSLFNSWSAVFILIILLVAVARTFISVKKILRHSPGDLVYERDV